MLPAAMQNSPAQCTGHRYACCWARLMHDASAAERCWCGLDVTVKGGRVSNLCVCKNELSDSLSNLVCAAQPGVR